MSTRSGALAAAFALFLVVSGAALARPAAAQVWTPQDSAKFEIYQDDRLLGIEDYRTFKTGDTLVVTSALDLSGAREGSTLPRFKETMFLRKADSSYPIVFHVTEMQRDSSQTSINCVFRDTTVVIYRENKRGGVGDAIALPPGRLYLLEPGIYAQIQTLLGDFVQSSQNKRVQQVLIPAIGQVVEVTLKRGPRENLGQDRFMVKTTRVDMTDKLTNLSAWLDSGGRMWKLEAKAQGLSVERLLPEGLTANAEGETQPRSGAAQKKKGGDKR